MSLERPTKYSIPHFPFRTMSWVRNQPSTNASALASGSSQYPAVTFGPLMRSSPGVPLGTSRISSSTMRERTGGRTQPRQWSPAGKGGVCAT